MLNLVRIGYESKIFNGASYCSDPGNVTPTGVVEDKCHYSNWTSCSYFCGDEKEEYSYRALLDDTTKARAECRIPRKPCDESVICTGDILAGADIFDLTQPLLTPSPGLQSGH